jgi:hypothetical protein
MRRSDRWLRGTLNGNRVFGVLEIGNDFATISFRPKPRRRWGKAGISALAVVIML